MDTGYDVYKRHEGHRMNAFMDGLSKASSMLLTELNLVSALGGSLE